MDGRWDNRCACKVSWDQIVLTFSLLNGLLPQMGRWSWLRAWREVKNMGWFERKVVISPVHVQGWKDDTSCWRGLCLKLFEGPRSVPRSWVGPQAADSRSLQRPLLWDLLSCPCSHSSCYLVTQVQAILGWVQSSIQIFLLFHGVNSSQIKSIISVLLWSNNATRNYCCLNPGSLLILCLLLFSTFFA